MIKEKIQSFEKFWPFYVCEHRSSLNRTLHFIGTSSAIANLCLAILYFQPLFLLSAVFSGYFFAWIGHFKIERNRPATFKYPFYSLVADYKMFFLTLLGKMSKELERCEGIQAHQTDSLKSSKQVAGS